MDYFTDSKRIKYALKLSCGKQLNSELDDKTTSRLPIFISTCAFIHIYITYYNILKRFTKCL